MIGESRRIIYLYFFKIKNQTEEVFNNSVPYVLYKIIMLLQILI